MAMRVIFVNVTMILREHAPYIMHLECLVNKVTASFVCYLVTNVIFQLKGFITSPVNCTDNDIKLLSENSDNRGIVLICKNGAWTRVCTHNYYYWSNNNANVVCRQLGYTVYGTYYRMLYIISLITRKHI